MSVYAAPGHLRPRSKTRGEDHAVCILEYEGGAHRPWPRTRGRSTGGIDDRAEIYGSKGLTVADLLRGNALTTFSESGYGYAVEKAPETKGWTFTMFEETWNYGFPQEMQHFVDCVAATSSRSMTGEDGRAVLEIIYAAYLSARTGQRSACASPSRKREEADRPLARRLIRRRVCKTSSHRWAGVQRTWPALQGQRRG